MLPIVQRELKVAARNPKLYSRRLRWGILQALIACVILIASGGGFRPATAEWFFRTLAVLALSLTLLEGLRKTSDAIASEKREGTLGFLFLSSLSGTDVVLGKFVGAFIRSLSALLPFLPILAISLLVGGTTLGEFFRVSLVLVLTLVTALSLCLFTSTFSREKSIVSGLLALSGLVLAPLIGSIFWNNPAVRLISPFMLLQAGWDLNHRASPGQFWLGAGLLGIVAVAAISAASFGAPRVWLERAGRSRMRGATSIRRATERRPLLEQNPVLWLHYDERGRAWFNGLSIVLLVCGAGPLIALWARLGNRELWAIFPALAAAVLCLMLYFRIALQSATSLAEAKRDGSLELLLSTPLAVDDVIKGFWLALWRGVQVPAFCLIPLLGCVLMAETLNSAGQIVWISKAMIELLLEPVVLASVGMWMGLRAKTRASAVVYTILLGGLVPWIGCVFTILIQIVLILRGLDQVKACLTRIRRGGDSLGLQDLMWRPSSFTQPHIPPVIR